MTDPMYCHMCEDTAREICYNEHIFDPDRRIASPDLAEGLYTSALELLPTEMVPWQAGLDTSMLDLGIDFLASDGSVLDAEVDRSPELDIERLLKEGYPAPSAGGQSINGATTMPAEWTEVAAAPRPPAICARPPPDLTPSGTEYLSRCRRSTSNPNLGEESQRRYVEVLSSLQGRVLRALQVIEAEKNKLRLTRSRVREWASLLQRGRDLAVSQAFNVTPGYRFPLLDI
ncbi:hypothetical protein BDW69DRAFT_180434 [Aspergillus filifer]